ncbi:MAG: hypothetical protein K2P37_12810 [Oscillospiraceae bacterium]|nr:hypothetical protein [Oscillospiraceae bacterium]MDE6933555.1 hypothetical protein [Oscillospiraceae bacterium]
MTKNLNAFLRIMFAAGSITENNAVPPHIFYYPEPGGVFLKAQKLAMTCLYSEDERSAAQIILSSFEAFLKKELRLASRGA